jgi:hypothetical protein
MIKAFNKTRNKKILSDKWHLKKTYS